MWKSYFEGLLYDSTNALASFVTVLAGPSNERQVGVALAVMLQRLAPAADGAHGKNHVSGRRHHYLIQLHLRHKAAKQCGGVCGGGGWGVRVGVEGALVFSSLIQKSAPTMSVPGCLCPKLQLGAQCTGTTQHPRTPPPGALTTKLPARVLTAPSVVR